MKELSFENMEVLQGGVEEVDSSCYYCALAAIAASLGFLPGLLELAACIICYNKQQPKDGEW